MPYPQKNIHHQEQGKMLLKDNTSCGLQTKAIWWAELPQHSVLPYPPSQPKKSGKQEQKKTWKLVYKKGIVQLLTKLSPLRFLELPPSSSLLLGAVHFNTVTPAVALWRKNGRREKNDGQQKGPSPPWFKGTVHSAFVTKTRTGNSQFLALVFSYWS